MFTLFSQNSVLLVVMFVYMLNIRNVKTENFNIEDEALPSGCGSDGDCLSTPVDCDSKCGCDEAYFYNESTKECVLNVRHLMKALLTVYDPVDLTNDKSMSANIRRQADKVFRGMTFAVIIIGSCALVGLVSACLYCFHIKNSDRRLKKDVKALAKKLHRDQKLKKPAKVSLKLKEQSCNVVVEDAGVFVC